jgi:hypothetical protein
MANATAPATTTTESDDMDYEPATEEENEDVNNEAFLEHLLAEGDGEVDDEDDEGSYASLSIKAQMAYYPLLKADVPYTEIEVEIEEPSAADGNETETERCEPY